MSFIITQRVFFYSTEYFFKLNEPLINCDVDVFKSLLTDIQFDNTALDTYALTGEKYNKCFNGACNTSRSHRSKNCSEACSLFIDDCYVDDLECSEIYCSESSGYQDNNTVCYNYNEINLWKGVGMKLTKTNYYFSQLKDTVPYNESCREGFKECGYLNREKDKLCVTLYEYCPINKVVIKNDNITPTDFEYTMRQMGDKYLFYTNESTNNTLYQSIYVETEIGPSYIDVQTGINTTNYTEVLDTQPITDFLNENSHIYDGKYPKSAEELSKYGDAKLLLMENTNDSLEELKKLQKIYLEKLSLYTDEKLKEMNEDAVSYNLLLLFFNIATFLYTIVIGIVFCYKKKNQDIDVHGMPPLKSILIFLLGLSPVIIFNILSFVFIIIRKSTLKTYSSMDYIDEYIYCGENKNNCYYNNLPYYDNVLLICYIIGFVIIIIHPLIIASILIYECLKQIYINQQKLKQEKKKLEDTPTGPGVEMKTSYGEALVSASSNSSTPE